MSTTQIPTAADYVIVGGGTAGLVLAARLSEDPGTSVVVLEAGTNHLEDPRVNIPALWTTLFGTDADWAFATVPQVTLGDRTINAAQGKMLGGSSGINGQAFVSASELVIDAWSKLGNEGWTWKNLHPYYKKSYTLNLPDDETCEHLGLNWVEPSAHGSSGPIQVSFPGQLQNPLVKAWVELFKSIGYDVTADPYSGASTGGFSSLAAVDPQTKTRSYSANTYGIAAMQRPGVRIVTDAFVKKVLLEGSKPDVHATGVEVDVKGQLVTVGANKEVIITAGALNTPKLLELSGIGNKKILQKYNIPVVVDNPNVGENLQDHLMSGISFEVVDGVVTGDPLLRQEPEATQSAMQMYSEHKAGPMTIGGVQSSALMPILEFAGVGGQESQTRFFDKYLPTASAFQSTVRDIFETHKAPTCDMFMFLAQANLHEANTSCFVGTRLLPGNYLSLGVMQSIPFSRGHTHISSANPEDKQTIDPRYFSHPLDIEILAQNLLDVERLHENEALTKYLKKPNGRRNHSDSFLTDVESAKKYLRDTVTTAYHFSGTASMLPEDQGGVVNENLVVHGTLNLRVCDASIFPVIPPANLMATVYAVAERAADIIKTDA
ncbi:glucose-methanol-choline oxidoreductase [Histoplasma capsulatum var. duboisii H88]|uniref:Glucose-methanol-choline oxidoreductase n=2 Tax=Ajellomyces capsulatus TaxID=5037 RepID=F0UD32_AJEC8|nr:glucose-methanol-choline oxidoreductase [Histoplasma capsulatum var. duboisii H88]QSS49637.1 glucose-methanol-choline oxidoreductase [Histoplasma capsulatum var. duboisii H88]